MEIPNSMRVNEKGHLEIGGCDSIDLVNQFGSPLYVMDESLIRKNCKSFVSALNSNYPNSEVIYASKAFMTKAICRIIEEEGLGLDVVSGGELYTALQADFPMDRVYFHGNNKSLDELKMALEAGVSRIVVDNFYELEILNDLCKEMHRHANIILRITPGIEAHTHDYIKTGQIDSKFGFVLENGQAFLGIEKVKKMKRLKLTGIHCHIGSQIFETAPFELAAKVMLKFIHDVKEKYKIEIKELNLGGGFGIKYTSSDKPLEFKDYIKTITSAVENYCEKYSLSLPKIIIEPGRAIVGNAGITLYTVGAIKDIPGIRKYVSVDGGMSDNIRPALYQAKYNAVIANKCLETPTETVSIAGKCCESGDMLIWDIKLPKMRPGDVLAIFSTGAYHYSMASNYNKLPRPATVLVNNGSADLIIKRETYEDLLKNDVVPRRLQKRSVSSA